MINEVRVSDDPSDLHQGRIGLALSSPEAVCMFVCANGWMRERGVCVCFYVCLCICIRSCVCVCVCLCVHSEQHTPRLRQTDSKPRYPHTRLPRLIVHEIRTFGLQNNPPTPPPITPPWEIEFYGSPDWDNGSNGLDCWKEIPRQQLDGSTRKPNINTDTFSSTIQCGGNCTHST